MRYAILVVLLALGACAKGPHVDTIKPLSVIAVKDCGHLMGVLVVDMTGQIHNMGGPFDTAAKAAFAELGKQVPDQKKNLATIDMPCKAESDDAPNADAAT